MTGELAIRKFRAFGRKDFVVGSVASSLIQNGVTHRLTSLTGNALKADQVAYKKAGADEVLIKP
jgi:hypothetical protein